MTAPRRRRQNRNPPGALDLVPTTAAHQQKITGIRARQSRHHFRLTLSFDRQIFPRVHDQVELARQESGAKVLREDALLRHLPERVILVAIAERLAK